MGFIPAIDRKLLRDLLYMKGQAVAIALVIACGITIYSASRSTYASLSWSQQAFYDRYRFADVFASAKRAPDALAERIAAIPGVAAVDTRIVFEATASLEHMAEPAVVRFVSVADDGAEHLNGLHIRLGRRLERGRDDEVLISEAFADKQGLRPGDSFSAVINGRLRRLVIVGVALSPEYVYALPSGGLLPDDRHFGIAWMGREALESAYDMQGAFNDLSLRLMRSASAEDVLDRVDALLAPYGGLEAYSREDQVSHRFLSDELRQLRTTSWFIPVIFLAVAAFLVNVALSRVVRAQREQIAVLKAFGYTRGAIAAHYLKLVFVIVVVGTLLGWLVGMRLGQGWTGLYAKFYRFPSLEYRVEPGIGLAAAAFSAAAAALGALAAVRQAAQLPPAEAMRPEPPVVFRATFLERLGVERLLSQPARIILRNLERRPLTSGLSVVGIAFAAGIVVLGGFFGDAMDYLMSTQFEIAERGDVEVTLRNPADGRAAADLAHLPGVLRVEGYRAAPVTLRHGHLERRTAILGLGQGGELRRLIGQDLGRTEVPEAGLCLTGALADMLDLRLGDEVVVDVLEGRRERHTVPLVARVDEPIGLAAYMDVRALARLLGEEPTVSGARLAVDSTALDPLYARLKATPAVAGLGLRREMLRTFDELVAESLLVMTTMQLFLGIVIACGVVYNNARITLAERSRELATLRVLGFTKREIAGILLGELAVLTLVALPLGLAVGYGMCWSIGQLMSTDLYRLPVIVHPSTYGMAVVVVLGAALVSGLAVARRLGSLDLVAVLKARD